MNFSKPNTPGHLKGHYHKLLYPFEVFEKRQQHDKQLQQPPTQENSALTTAPSSATGSPTSRYGARVSRVSHGSSSAQSAPAAQLDSPAADSPTVAVSAAEEALSATHSLLHPASDEGQAAAPDAPAPVCDLCRQKLVAAKRFGFSCICFLGR